MPITFEKQTIKPSGGSAPYDLYILNKPKRYDEIHVTIPSDPSGMNGNGSIITMAAQPHVTFVWTDESGAKKKLHCYIATSKNKYMPFDGTGKPRSLDSGKRLLFNEIVNHGVINKALFEA